LTFSCLDDGWLTALNIFLSRVPSLRVLIWLSLPLTITLWDSMHSYTSKCRKLGTSSPQQRQRVDSDNKNLSDLVISILDVFRRTDDCLRHFVNVAILYHTFTRRTIYTTQQSQVSSGWYITIINIKILKYCAFSALTLLARRQEEHPTCKN